MRLKYLLVYILPITVCFSFSESGLWTFSPVILFFVILPIIELFIKPDTKNFDEKTERIEGSNKMYDWIVFLAVPVQLFVFIYFLHVIDNSPVNSVEFLGKISSMGFMCGVLGINIGHELGHRRNKVEKFLGEILLLTSLDTHFHIYHNEMHHRDVATPRDPATAKRDQLLYLFWITSHFGSYIKAWKIENHRMKKANKSVLSLNNRMIVYSIANIFLLVTIYHFFNLIVLLAFIAAAIIGIILLETVNYIEHYGLLRKRSEEGDYERVRHCHSWNSDHQLGRMLLFNLSRHSDHHYNGGKKYQILLSHSDSPQMPTGYPGMMVLAVLQPFWFLLMNRKLDQLVQNAE
ncbi:alkane 1-monooxygenase [Ekhidna sp.]|uniref:alkane 1-monooxygenase n=1 Tax=Ekhidna sp. TaxID=2608089 RepID=UPI003297B057